MLSKTALIIRREYLERVNKKSFIITTLLMPVVMLALMFTPVLIAEFGESDNRTIAVVDESGEILQQIQSEPPVTFVGVPDKAAGNTMLDSAVAQCMLIIPANIYEPDADVQLISSEPSSMNVESAITSQLNTIIEHKRMAAYGIDNLDSIMTAVESDVTLRTLKYNAEGDDTESSTVVAYVLGMILTMLLYMCLLLYGQMVMTSIIEEKTNRVLEIVVSSVKPRQLMIGKICGIGLVAVTQILIWTILIAGASSLLLPSMISPEIASQVDALNANTLSAADATTDIDMLQAVAMLGNVGYILQLFALLLLFLIGGFMLYAAVYAAIGSSVDNIQDAGQLQSIVIIPVICGIIFGVQAASDPSSTLSVWTSIIPFTSPMVMMARIPFGVPGWEIALSLIVLYLSFFAMVWVAAKIYRVGIFMYGKKPSVKEMIRWIRYN